MFVGCGVGGVGQPGSGRRQPPPRDLFATLSALAGTLPETVVIERRRLDFLEYVMRMPMTADGIEWLCTYWTHRFNAGFLASIDMVGSYIARLYVSASLAAYPSNLATGTMAVAPIATGGVAGATDTGTWTAPATIGGVAGVSWPNPQNAGASRARTIDNSSGAIKVLYLVGYSNVSNGGIGKLVVRVDGVEIDEDQYFMPLTSGERRIDYRSQPVVGLTLIPAAQNLPAGIITYEISESAANPVGGRLYDAGWQGFAAFPYNVAGLYGVAPVVTGDRTLIMHPGAKVVYRCTDITSVSWRYQALPNTAFADFQLFDSDGNDVSDLLAFTTLDTYFASGGPSSGRQINLISGQPRTEYWLHASVSKTRNASATRYGIEDRGVFIADQTTAGTPGVHPFDTGDVPSNPAGPRDFGSEQLIGPANLRFAFRARAASSPADAIAFLTGYAHGFETSPDNWTLFINGLNQTAAFYALPVGGFIIGTAMRTTQSTIVKSPIIKDQPIPTKWDDPEDSNSLILMPSIATINYIDDFSGPDGWIGGGTLQWTDTVVVDRDFGVKLQAESRRSPSRGAGGGFDNLATSSEGNFVANQYNDSSRAFNTICDQFAFTNSAYTVAARITNRQQANSGFTDFSGTARGLYISYVTGLNKVYSDIVPSFPASKIYTAGQGYTKRVQWRAFKGPQMQRALGF